MLCPDCKRNLRPLQSSCKCGWKDVALAAPVSTIECAHIGCPGGAVARVGNANLCKAHYAAHWTPENINAHYVVKPSNPHAEEVRAAYLKSYAYRHRDDYAIVPQAPERKAA